MKVRTLDGATFEAETCDGLIDAIRADAWIPEETREEYIIKAAERAKTQTGCDVSTESAERFIADLMRAGLLTTIQ